MICSTTRTQLLNEILRSNLTPTCYGSSELWRVGARSCETAEEWWMMKWRQLAVWLESLSIMSNLQSPWMDLFSTVEFCTVMAATSYKQVEFLMMQDRCKKKNPIWSKNEGVLEIFGSCEFLWVLGEFNDFDPSFCENENSVMFRRSLSFYTMPLIMINNPLIQIGIVKLICNFPQFGQKCPFLITVQIAAQIWFQHVQNTTCNV